MAGEAVDLCEFGSSPAAAWVVGPDAAVQQVFDLYDKEVALANAVIGRAPPRHTASVVAG